MTMEFIENFMKSKNILASMPIDRNSNFICNGSFSSWEFLTGRQKFLIAVH